MNDVDLAISALADPTRRKVIELLVEAPRRTSELAAALGVSVPAVSRHLRVLREQEVVERVDVDGDARGRRYQLDTRRFEALGSWLDGNRWRERLATASDDASVNEYLARVGGFLDGFAQSDVSFFERHLDADVELVFPGSSVRWDRASTIASVEGHAPYIAWDIVDSSVRSLGTGLTLVVITVSVQTTVSVDAATVVQSMVFDDNRDPWTLRFLQQSPAD